MDNKSVIDIANEVLQGKWGNGDDRVNRLTNTGYNASEVQEVVNRLLNGNYTSLESKYPKLMSSWYSEWDAIIPIFKFSVKVRTVIYTTNAVESVNSRLRSMNKKRLVFSNIEKVAKS